MTIKKRTNKKTNKKEYKCRYSFKTSDGVLHDTETGWFPSEKEAIEAAKRLKEEKEKAETNNTHNRERLVKNVFSEFVDYLYQKDKETDATTYYNYYSWSHAILNKHIPKDIEKLKIKELTPSAYYNWLNTINKKSSVGGKYIRCIRDALYKFNGYLQDENYYLNLSEYLSYSAALKEVPLKSISVNNKEDAGLRHWYDVNQLHALVSYYRENLGEFNSFYWYTFFYVLFFSGMRVEEIVALQWNDIDFNLGTLTIDDSIARVETKERVKKRLNENVKKTKNKDSVRTIPILDFYYELLKDYSESYQYQFNLKKSEMSDCFVFPNLTHNNPNEYQLHDNIANALQKAAKAKKLPKTDAQMFRHSCAYFLIVEPPKGLGYDISKVYDYFGHQNESMIRTVYGRFSKEQKTDKLLTTFSDIATTYVKPDTVKQKEAEIARLIERITGDNKELNKARKERIFGQIDYVSKKTNKNVYYYRQSDQSIIDEYTSQHPETKLRFVQEG